MSYIDTKYLNIISPYLQQFKKKGDNLWNFRCPYCGDSQKSRTKARGFVFRKKNDLFFKCHNCGTGASLGNLIKTIDSKTYKDYIMERYKKGVETRSSPQPEFKFNAPVFRKKGILEGLQSIKDLPDDHPARQIVEKRKLPLESFSDLYLCESFFKFTNSIIKGKFPSLDGDHPRLLIPFRDEKGEVLIQNMLCPIIGKISMDSFIVDTSKIEVKVGDAVEIFGKNNTVIKMAGKLNTIPYEIYATLNRRIKRIYIGN